MKILGRIIGITIFLFLQALFHRCAFSQGPTITNLAVTAMTSSTVTIQWTTNQASSSQLIYGAGALNQATPVVGTLVTAHSLTLTGLTGGQVWQYEAVSVNSAGHSTTSAAQQFEMCDSESGVTASGTVNNYYEYGLYTITWQNQSGYSVSPTLCGAPLQQTWTGGLDHGASFGLNLPNNLEIVPSPSNWEIGVTGIDGSIGSFNISFSNSTPSTNITTALQAAAAGNLIHVWYDPATSTFYPPIATGGVSQIVAGTNVTISPSGGTGVVTVNASGGSGTPALPFSSLQYNNGGAFGGANGDYGTTNFYSFTLGQVQYSPVSTYNCDGTNCTFQATNNFIAGENVLLDYTFDNSCLYGTDSPALSTGLSSSQFELVESDTQCSGVASGIGGNASSDSAGLWVNAGHQGIELIANGSGDIGTGITLCTTSPTALNCAAGEDGNLSMSLTADSAIVLGSANIGWNILEDFSAGFAQSSFQTVLEDNSSKGIALDEIDGAPINIAANNINLYTLYSVYLGGTSSGAPPSPTPGTVPGSLQFVAGVTPPTPATNTVQISAPISVTAYNVNLPGAQDTGALTNDGSGNLGWGIGPATAPTGSCTTGIWVFTQDGKGSFCKAGTWEVAVTAP